MYLTSVIVGCLLVCTSSVLARKKDNAVLLSKVKSLTLRHGHSTSHRRVEAIPQLTCAGGNGQGFYDVDVMRCYNSGSEYDTEDISWTCKADLPPEFKLGSTEVICEGYDSSDDPYVLKGSCGVEYRLILTELGEQKYRHHINYDTWRKSPNMKDLPKKEGSNNDALAQWLFWLIFAAIVILIVYSIFFPSGNNGRASRNGARRGWGAGYGGGGGGGGGYDDGHDGPPPPYTPRAPPKPKSPSTSNSRTSRSHQQNAGWQPGFWTGTAAGAAAGYAAGSYNNRRQERNQARPGTSNWFGGTNTSPRDGYTRSSYFGAGGSSSNSPSYGGTPSFGAGPSNSVPTPSSSRQETTGFGGTRRR